MASSHGMFPLSLRDDDTALTISAGTDGPTFRLEDVVHVRATGEAIRITEMSGGHKRYWEPLTLRERMWSRLRGRGDSQIRVLEWWPLRMRFTRG